MSGPLGRPPGGLSTWPIQLSRWNIIWRFTKPDICMMRCDEEFLAQFTMDRWLLQSSTQPLRKKPSMPAYFFFAWWLRLVALETWDQNSHAMIPTLLHCDVTLSEALWGSWLRSGAGKLAPFVAWRRSTKLCHRCHQTWQLEIPVFPSINVGFPANQRILGSRLEGIDQHG